MAQGHPTPARHLPVEDRDLFFVGLALYWAEGGKSKPWAIRDHITFINRDPSVIVVFMRAASAGRREIAASFHLSIHETADIPGAERYWADLVGVGVTSFNRSSIKRNNPKTVRYNTGVEYRGCLVVDVLQSAVIYRKVEGWWQGLTASATRIESIALLAGSNPSPLKPLV
jgi:hypothetical protein